MAMVTNKAGFPAVCIMHVGDSRALLGTLDGSLVRDLTSDHSPGRSDELHRIRKTNNDVIWINEVARIDGNLAVSRAFGDSKYKHAEKELSAVIVEPDVLYIPAWKDNELLILCCDGIHESKLSSEDILLIIKNEYYKSQDLALAARAVCLSALHLGSRDNLSCMIISNSIYASKPDNTEEFEEILPWPIDIRMSQAHAAFKQRAGPECVFFSSA